MKLAKWYSKPEWCSTQPRSPRNTDQSARRTSTTFCYVPVILRQGSSDLKDSKVWFYHCFKVKGETIFVDNSQGEKLIQPSAVAFFRTFELFTTPLLRPYGHPGACGTTIDQSDVDFTFCTAEPCKKWNCISLVDSRAIWDKFAQLVYSLQYIL